MPFVVKFEPSLEYLTSSSLSWPGHAQLAWDSFFYQYGRVSMSPGLSVSRFLHSISLTK